MSIPVEMLSSVVHGQDNSKTGINNSFFIHHSKFDYGCNHTFQLAGCYIYNGAYPRCTYPYMDKNLALHFIEVIQKHASFDHPWIGININMKI